VVLDLGLVEDMDFSETNKGGHDISSSGLGRLGSQDAADTVAPHNLTDLDGRQVGAHIVEPAAHGRVEGEEEALEEELAILEVGLGGCGDSLPAEGLAGDDLARGALSELELERLAGHCG